jgi:2',3'-cyclic-nucleotide 2'-phosphodiesterase (5'-nucleotidase family)
MNRKKFTILHSSDIHGDFQAEDSHEINKKMVGGLSLLSGKSAAKRKMFSTSFPVIWCRVR